MVVAQGEITDGKQPQGAVGGDSTSELIRQAREDDDVKALVLRVDSPGGGVFPSEQIRREIALTKEAGKPVVVSMGNVAASGGYWISMNADRIYADPSTITGSIGIFGLWMSAPRALDKIGVHSDGVGTTPLAGVFDIDPSARSRRRRADPVGDRPRLRAVHRQGRRGARQRAGKDRQRSRAAASGAARRRKERGLVDELGGLARSAGAKRRSWPSSGQGLPGRTTSRSRCRPSTRCSWT